MPFHAITAADISRAGEIDREALRRRAAHAGPVGDDTMLYRIEFHLDNDGRLTRRVAARHGSPWPAPTSSNASHIDA